MMKFVKAELAHHIAKYGDSFLARFIFTTDLKVSGAQA